MKFLIRVEVKELGYWVLMKVGQKVKIDIRVDVVKVGEDFGKFFEGEQGGEVWWDLVVLECD